MDFENKQSLRVNGTFGGDTESRLLTDTQISNGDHERLFNKKYQADDDELTF